MVQKWFRAKPLGIGSQFFKNGQHIFWLEMPAEQDFSMGRGPGNAVPCPGRLSGNRNQNGNIRKKCEGLGSVMDVLRRPESGNFQKHSSRLAVDCAVMATGFSICTRIADENEIRNEHPLTSNQNFPLSD